MTTGAPGLLHWATRIEVATQARSLLFVFISLFSLVALLVVAVP